VPPTAGNLYRLTEIGWDRALVRTVPAPAANRPIRAKHDGVIEAAIDLNDVTKFGRYVALADVVPPHARTTCASTDAVAASANPETKTPARCLRIMLLIRSSPSVTVRSKAHAAEPSTASFKGLCPRRRRDERAAGAPR